MAKPKFLSLWLTRERIKETNIRIGSTNLPMLAPIFLHTLDTYLLIIDFSKPRAFVPLLMWMSNYAKGVNSVKTAFLAIMFPNRDLEAEAEQTESPGVAPPGNDADTVGNAIIGHMCSIEMAVKHWSNELMYIIVDEDGTTTMPTVTF